MARRKQQSKEPKQGHRSQNSEILIPVFYFGTSNKFAHTSVITGKHYEWVRNSKTGLTPMVMVDIKDVEFMKNLKGRAENPTRIGFLFS